MRNDKVNPKPIAWKYSSRNARDVIMQCIKCGSPGPFYASQSHCYCIPCHKAACKRTPAQTAHTRALRQARTVRALLRLRDTDADALTRRQHLRLLRLDCPPYKKV